METLIIIILLFIIVGMIIAFVKYYRKTKKKEIKSDIDSLSTYIEQEEDKLREKAKKMEDYIEAFAKLGWDKWAEEIHCSEKQYRKMTECKIDIDCIIMYYNRKTQNARILSKSGNIYLTNGKQCSCPNFRKEKVPCKHMYCLAFYHVTHRSYENKGNQLKGLHFCVIGKNQEPVKEYIYKHKGTTGDFSINKTSAVVLSSDTENSTVEKARKNDMEILTFDELKELFP